MGECVERAMREGKIVQIGTVPYAPETKGLWEQSRLQPVWYSQYAGTLFTEGDMRIVSPGHQPRLHFGEWLAAIAFYNTFEWISLQEDYYWQSDPEKTDLLPQILPGPVCDYCLDWHVNGKDAQLPDLLVYAPDYSGWFFCEVKVEDSLSEKQAKVFSQLCDIARKPVALLRCKEVEGPLPADPTLVAPVPDLKRPGFALS